MENPTEPEWIQLYEQDEQTPITAHCKIGEEVFLQLVHKQEGNGFILLRATFKRTAADALKILTSREPAANSLRSAAHVLSAIMLPLDDHAAQVYSEEHERAQATEQLLTAFNRELLRTCNFIRSPTVATPLRLDECVKYEKAYSEWAVSVQCTCDSAVAWQISLYLVAEEAENTLADGRPSPEQWAVFDRYFNLAFKSCQIVMQTLSAYYTKLILTRASGYLQGAIDQVMLLTQQCQEQYCKTQEDPDCLCDPEVVSATSPPG